MTYKLNHKCFDTLTPDSLYWMGFLMADGYINKKGNQLDLTLGVLDADHTDRFKSFLETDKPIYKKYNKKIGKEYRRVCVYSPHLVGTLISNNIVNKKSLISNPTKDCAQSKDFWRGVMDGDGHIYDYMRYRKNRENPGRNRGITLVGSKTLLESFSGYIDSLFGYSPTIVKFKHAEVFNLRLSGSKAAEVVNHLYKDSSTHLPRKYDLAMQIVKPTEELFCVCQW